MGLLILITLLSGLTAARIYMKTGWLWLLPVSFLGSFPVYALLSFLVLLGLCALVDRKKPQEADSPFYRAVARVYIDGVIKLFRIRIHTEGAELVPKDRRFLLVCNHQSSVDPAMLLQVFPDRQLAFISKRENEKLPVIGPLMHKLLCQSLDRDNDRDALKTILSCIRLLKEDKVSIAVFPEGATHKDEALYPFRNGVFKVAQKAQVPVVVCTVRGTRHVLPAMARLKSSDVWIHVLGVIHPEEYRGLTTIELGDRIHGMMEKDLLSKS